MAYSFKRQNYMIHEIYICIKNCSQSIYEWVIIYGTYCLSYWKQVICNISICVCVRLLWYQVLVPLISQVGPILIGSGIWSNLCIFIVSKYLVICFVNKMVLFSKKKIMKSLQSTVALRTCIWGIIHSFNQSGVIHI